MGGSFADSGCKRHPHEHLRQLPGVCPSCLTEKLSRLNNNNNISPSTKYSTTTADSNSSHLSSFSSSSNSPPQQQARYRRNQSDITCIINNTSCTMTRVRRNLAGSGGEGCGPMAGGLGGDQGLKKSRSVACAAPVSYREDEDRSSRNVSGSLNKKVKKSGGGGGARGLWKKLMRSASKKSKGGGVEANSGGGAK